jgi:hypothetical protein
VKLCDALNVLNVPEYTVGVDPDPPPVPAGPATGSTKTDGGAGGDRIANLGPGGTTAMTSVFPRIMTSPSQIQQPTRPCSFRQNTRDEPEPAPVP